jgi:hypothetical protein
MALRIDGLGQVIGCVSSLTRVVPSLAESSSASRADSVSHLVAAVMGDTGALRGDVVTRTPSTVRARGWCRRCSEHRDL